MLFNKQVTPAWGPQNLTSWPKNLMSSLMSQDARVATVRKIINAYCRRNRKQLWKWHCNLFNHALTLNFELLPPKSYQFIFIPSCTTDKSTQNSIDAHCTPKIKWNHHCGKGIKTFRQHGVQKWQLEANTCPLCMRFLMQPLKPSRAMLGGYVMSALDRPPSWSGVLMLR